ncbi:MAG: methylenetetrahydrofolate reductase [NAD(P)H] [Burkholderiaceae bacterium]|jgi:methylenetetrahydrofolate reductase (NADPH)|nr:methylenetetrahydrofolate reductase [NAD(P)H] [Burkholderiaceae bacterium]
MGSLPFSIEFFPPKTPEALARLRETRERLVRLSPRYFSVTLGAGGSARDGTLDVAVEIHKKGYEAAPHLTCIGTSRESIRDRLREYQSLGIRHLVALRGDLPSPYGELGDFRYASELVAFVRAETGDWFHVDVAAYPEVHPQATSPQDDLKYFINKVKAGADTAITQYFYNPDAYFHFVDAVQRAGVFIPIVPGIMPITNYSSLVRFSDTCGADIPRWIRLRLDSYGDDTVSIKAFGLEVVTALCERLREGGAPGFHFYSLNQAAMVEALCANLRLAG